jgi:sulfotransferase family protein
VAFPRSNAGPTFPNTFVIGAPRSGTTSLYEYLSTHPDVFMSPVKEPEFFSGSSRHADLDRYLALFERAGDEKVRGEASTGYLAHPTAAIHLQRCVPEARIIAILRDPADRAHSHFVHTRRMIAENRQVLIARCEGRSMEEEFSDVVDDALRDGSRPPARTTAEVWLRTGFYHEHLSRFRSLFAEDQLRVILFDDLVADTNAVMAGVFRFLGVDEAFRLPTTAAFNVSVVPRHVDLFGVFTTRNSFMRSARLVAPARVRATAMRVRNRLLAAEKPTLPVDLRRKLVAIYRDDILRLQDLLHRDLSSWLDVEKVK